MPGLTARPGCSQAPANAALFAKFGFSETSSDCNFGLRLARGARGSTPAEAADCLSFRALARTATARGGAAQICRLGAALLAALLVGCQAAPEPRSAGLRVLESPAPSEAEEYCAWYGDARSGVLYFGQAAFWSAFRAAGDDPRGDLLAPGPQLIGRFDLESERFLEPLDVTEAGARSGVWDVHAHENGRVYFTTFYESMGAVDTATGAVTRFPGLGLGLNEIAPLAGGDLLVTRYGAAEPGGADTGALVVITPAGQRVAEYPIDAPHGYSAAPKTPAWDSAQGEYWTTNDLIPKANGGVETDATVLGADGAALRRIASPEVQFVAAAPGGGIVRLENRSDGLWLLGPGDAPTSQLLDANFIDLLDFAQDLKFDPTGNAVAARWSGWVHVANGNGGVRSLRLPALAEHGLYYTAVRHGDRICATYCGGVRVVCADAP